MKYTLKYYRSGILVLLAFSFCFNNTLLNIDDGISWRQLSKIKAGISRSDLIRLMGNPVSQNTIDKEGKQFDACYYNYREILNPSKRKNEKTALSETSDNYTKNGDQHKLTIILQNDIVLKWMIDPGEMAEIQSSGKPKNKKSSMVIGIVFLGLIGTFFALR